MDSKRVIYLGMLVGSAVGGFIPTLWDDSYLSLSSVVFTAIGGFFGIWIAYKITR